MRLLCFFMARNVAKKACWFRAGLAGLGLWTAGTGANVAAEVSAEELLNGAQAAQMRSNHVQAFELVGRAIALDPKNPQCFYVRGRLHASNREHASAIADFDRVLQMEPRAKEVYLFRGFEHFKLSHFDRAIADFDAFVQAVPSQGPYQWQRGIACYYAGRYEDARRQFELHHTVNSNDVENVIWHFASVARARGLDAARRAVLRIQLEPRGFVRQLHDLLTGQAKPEEVLKAATDSYSSRAQRQQQEFHAHFYVGLYYELIGDAKKARHYITQAAEDFALDTYMGSVARVHADLLRKNSPSSNVRR
jgi:lipoprotein NlpI